MNIGDAALETLRGDIINIILGAIFLTVGATACAIAAIRRRAGVRMLIWWGIFSGMYGLQILGQASIILTVLPHSFMSVAVYVRAAVTFFLPVSAFFAWRELALGVLRFVIGLEIFVGSAIAVAGLGALALGASADKWIFYKNLLAVLGLPILLAVVLVPRLSRLHVISNYRLLAAVLVIFALVVLYTNLGTLLHYHALPLVDSLGFAALLFSLGYIALQILFANERRLLSIETELETARQIQSLRTSISLLPTSP
jgi:phosphoserine phosphatase RsbU/P